jgi:hypothetical protein
MKHNVSPQRRMLVASVLVLAGCDKLSEAADLDGSWAKLSEEDKALRRKFRGLRGGQLVVDAFGEKHGVNIFGDDGKLFFSQATLSIRNNTRLSYSANFGVPKTLRAEWRDPATEFRPHTLTGAYDGGTVIANYTVPVASRIPDEVLDAVRSKKGGFRLKLRLHDDGLLIGWDIESRLGASAGVYSPAVRSFVGGDFQEADIVDGKPVRKGWYIDPKTKQRIETDV